MNRPTRVPASSVVRMNSASNMMREVIPERHRAARRRATCENRCAIPTARLGAPPVRERSDVSPTCSRERLELRGVTTNPHCATAAAAVCTVGRARRPGR